MTKSFHPFDPVVFFALLSLLVTSVYPSIAMAEAGDETATVHIVHVARPDNEEPEVFHLRTLAAVLGRFVSDDAINEEAAKEAVIYHYNHAASGFSAKLTPKQVEELLKQPGVLQINPSRTYRTTGMPKANRMGI